MSPREMHNDTLSLYAPVFMLIQGYWKIYAQRKSFHMLEVQFIESKLI